MKTKSFILAIFLLLSFVSSASSYSDWDDDYDYYYIDIYYYDKYVDIAVDTGNHNNECVDVWLIAISHWGIYSFDIMTNRWLPYVIKPTWSGVVGNFNEQIPLLDLSLDGCLIAVGFDTKCNFRLDLKNLHYDIEYIYEEPASTTTTTCFTTTTISGGSTTTTTNGSSTTSIPGYQGDCAIENYSENIVWEDKGSYSINLSPELAEKGGIGVVGQEYPDGPWIEYDVYYGQFQVDGWAVGKVFEFSIYYYENGQKIWFLPNCSKYYLSSESGDHLGIKLGN